MDLLVPLKLDSKKDIQSSSTEWESIKESLRNILMGNWGEKPFDFYFGANLSKFKRYPMNHDTFELIKLNIDFAIENYEQRVILNSTNLKFDKISRKLFIKIFIEYKGKYEELSISVVMG